VVFLTVFARNSVGATSIPIQLLVNRRISPHEAQAIFPQEGSLHQKGNRIDNSTACFVSSGAGTLAAIAILAKRFLRCGK
jgi:hypothetical protein